MVTDIREPFESYTDLKIWPNPVSDVLHLKSEQEAIERIQILDTNGKLVYQEENETTSSSIDLSRISKGIYYLTYVMDNKHYRTPIVKQ